MNSMKHIAVLLLALISVTVQTSAQDVIIKLPELVEASGQKYWKVTTTRDTLFFGFDGGEQIKDRKTLNSLKQ